VAPALTAVAEADRNGRGLHVVEPFAFKPSHYTREKDGRPSDLFPPLTADADKGDQDPVVCPPLPFAFDTTQITNPNNRSTMRPDAPTPALAAKAHPLAVAFTEPEVTSAMAVRMQFSGANGMGWSDEQAHTLDTSTPQAVAFSMRGRDGENTAEPEPDGIAPALRAVGGGSSHAFVAVNFERGLAPHGSMEMSELMPALTASEEKGQTAVVGARAFAEVSPTILGGGKSVPGQTVETFETVVADGDSEYAVRRITPIEAERLQGYRDNYTLIRWPSLNREGLDLDETLAYLASHGVNDPELAKTPDGPRYRAIGNSKAVHVVRRIGEWMEAAWPKSV